LAGEGRRARSLAIEQLAQLRRRGAELAGGGQVRRKGVHTAACASQAVSRAGQAARVLEQLVITVGGLQQVPEPFGGAMVLEVVVHLGSREEAMGAPRSAARRTCPPAVSRGRRRATPMFRYTMTPAARARHAHTSCVGR